MKKSQTARSLFAASCLVGSGCASGPPQRPPPPPEECPPGAVELAEQAHMIGEENYAFFSEFESTRIAIVREGEVTVEMPLSWHHFPSHTILSGRVFFGSGRVYGRFTRAHLPGGESLPVCMEWLSTDGLGIKMLPGSTAQEARIRWDTGVRAALRFN